MSNNFTITISKKGAAIALGAAVFGAGAALLVDEVFFDNYPEYSYSSSMEQNNSGLELSQDLNKEPVTETTESASAAISDTTATTESAAQTIETPAAESAAPDQVESSRITPAAAMEIAVRAAGGQTIDIYPGFEAGRDVFYVDIRDGAILKEVYVDAITGEVIKIENGP